jgi:hypothetical protein
MRSYCLNVLLSTFLKTTELVIPSVHCTEPLFLPSRKKSRALVFLGIMTNASQGKQSQGPSSHVLIASADKNSRNKE